MYINIFLEKVFWGDDWFRILHDIFPLFCANRWSEKYNCIKIFNNNFIKIKTVLDQLCTSTDANSIKRNYAYKHCIENYATSNKNCVISLKILAQYYANTMLC